MGILESYATISYYAMLFWIASVVLVDIAFCFMLDKRLEYGYLIASPVYWLVLLLLLPFLNIVLVYVIYSLFVKGTSKNKRK